MSLGSRFRQIADELGIYEQDLASALGFKTAGIASKWRERAEKGQEPGYESLVKVANGLWLSLDWLTDDEAEIRWSQRLLQARPNLVRLARGAANLREAPKHVRMAAAWEWLQKQIQFSPDAERIWAIYLHWTPADWGACRAGRLQPTAVQLAQAAWVTGIPERWFWDGDQACLTEYPPERLQELSNYLQAHNLWPDDVIRVLMQSGAHTN